jgi:hypothetical protein
MLARRGEARARGGGASGGWHGVARGHTLRVPRGGPGQGFARGVGIAGARPGQCGVRARSRGEEGERRGRRGKRKERERKK